MSIHEFRMTLGVEADEVERRAYASSGGVSTPHAVFQELVQEGGSSCSSWTRRFRTTYPG